MIKATITVRDVGIQRTPLENLMLRTIGHLGGHSTPRIQEGAIMSKFFSNPANDRTSSRVEAGEFESVAKMFFDSFVILDGR